MQYLKGMLGKVYLYPGNFLRSYLTYLHLGEGIDGRT